MQPISSDPVVSSYRILDRISRMRSRISSNDSQPFPSSNASHASQSGRREYWAKYAKPQTALCGALSLNRNGENGSVRNPVRAEGVQKLTSVMLGRAERNLYQP